MELIGRIRRLRDLLCHGLSRSAHDGRHISYVSAPTETETTHTGHERDARGTTRAFSAYEILRISVISSRLRCDFPIDDISQVQRLRNNHPHTTCVLFMCVGMRGIIDKGLETRVCHVISERIGVGNSLDVVRVPQAECNQGRDLGSTVGVPPFVRPCSARVGTK